MSSARYQHQQQLMQKLHASTPSHYGTASGGSHTGQPSGPSAQGGPLAHHHHNHTFSYPGPPSSPAGYPGYGPPQHGGPQGPPGNHLTQPSPGLQHHSGLSLGAPPGQTSNISGQSSYSLGHLGHHNGQVNGHHSGHGGMHGQSAQHGNANGMAQGQGSMTNGIANGNNANGQALQQTNLNNSQSAYWQQQMKYANTARQSTSQHHHARAAHLQQRGMTAAGSVPVADPTRHPVMSIGRGRDIKDKEANGYGPHKRNESDLANDQNSGLRTGPLSNVKSGAKGDTTASPIAANAKPANTAAAIEAEREKTGQPWSTIDMGGMHLRNLSAEMFRYTFLTTLYIPHNDLASLPAALSTLIHLVLLDASGNKLTSIPPELGMLTNLRELLLFDNQLTALPAELGTLHQLDILGIEGNPLPDNLRALMEKEGTSGLIAWLRDSCPVPLPPPDRDWIELSLPSTADAAEPEPGAFNVLCYNVLCEKAATPQMYGYTPSWALSWDYRKELILQEIVGYGSDIICLQEVDGGQYEDFFLPSLEQHGYEGLYRARTRARTMSSDEARHVDGCATFFKPEVFSLVEQQVIEFSQIAMRRPDFKKTEDMFNRVMTKDHIAVVTLLEHKKSGARLIAANVHVYWDPEFRDVKLVQVGIMMDELQKTADYFSRLPPRLSLGEGFTKAPVYSDGTKIPTVICGDFNSVADSGVYQYLANGSVAKNHVDFMEYVYGSYTSDGMSHKFPLKSAYAQMDSNAERPTGGLSFTNYTPGFKGTIDYIWYTANSLDVAGLLRDVDAGYLSRVVGFPNAHFPSDHIPILAEFKIRPQSQKEGPSRPVAPPNFGNTFTPHR